MSRDYMTNVEFEVHFEVKVKIIEVHFKFHINHIINVIVSNVREIRPFRPINVQCTTAILMLSSSIKTNLIFLHIVRATTPDER